jgi:hypothetical protein
MLDISFVNKVENIAKNPKVTAINSCIEVDITGQVVSDSIGTRMYSGEYVVNLSKIEKYPRKLGYGKYSAVLRKLYHSFDIRSKMPVRFKYTKGNSISCMLVEFHSNLGISRIAMLDTRFFIM